MPCPLMDFADDLIQAILLDHSRHPRHVGTLPIPPAHHGHGTNPACGDQVDLYLLLSTDRRLQEITFRGQGCAISQAAASLLTVEFKGLPLADAEQRLADITAMFHGHHDGPTLGQLRILTALRKFPARLACASVACQALAQALRNIPDLEAHAPASE